MSYSYLHDTVDGVLDFDTHKYPPASPFSSINSKTSVMESAPVPELASYDTSRLDTPYSVGYPILALAGLVFCFVAGITFIVFGIVVLVISPRHTLPSDILQISRWDPGQQRNIVVEVNHYANIALGLALNILVTACTEATGYVHGTTLKWGLAKEGRLKYNANLRLFSATKGLFSVNGAFVNILFLVSIVLSYAASSSVLLRFDLYDPENESITHSFSVISFLPLLLLGSVLVLQAVLGLIAFRKTPVPTWSSSPLDVSSALVLQGYIHRRPGRCMRPASKIADATNEPLRPSTRQPKAWACHKSVARVVYLVWATVGAFGAFTGLTWVFWLGRGWEDGAPPLGLLKGSLILGVIQSFITISLHCSELVTTLARDERVWRAASGAKGAQAGRNPVIVLLGSWQTCGLLVGKPVIHWLFGVSLGLQVGWGITPSYFLLGLPFGIMIVAAFVTVVAILRPSGPQPATYGNLQTLADVVDEWSTTMYWGHKEDGWGAGPWPVCHAGTTSEGPLPPIKMDSFYA